jgi:hypothetical protein
VARRRTGERRATSVTFVETAPLTQRRPSVIAAAR